MPLVIVRSATPSQINSFLTQASASANYLSKASASSIYLTQDSASNIYLTQESALSNYLPQSSASSTYLSQSNAALTYLSQSSASGTYLSQASASATYLPQTSASSTYLSQASASTTYLPQTSASSTYLLQSSASSTYLSQANAALTYLTQSSASSSYLTQASASTTYAPIVPSTQTGFRNRIINGDFRIDQRNNGVLKNNSSPNTALATTFGADRWLVSEQVTGTGFSQRLSDGTSPDKYYLSISRPSGINALIIAQRIEAINSYDLAGKQVTLSFRAAILGGYTSLSWKASYANTTDSFGSFSSPTTTQIATGNVTVSSSFNSYSVTFTVPSAATTGIEISFYNTNASFDATTLRLSNVQLELGTIATPFEQRPIGMELALCQRYYQNIVTPNATTDFNGLMVRESTIYAQASVYLPVSMRITPSLVGSYLGRSVFRDTSFNVAAGANSAISVSSSGPNSNWITLIITHAAVAGTYIYAEWDLLNTTTNLGLNAEL